MKMAKKHDSKISQVMNQTGCDRQTAIGYLDAEDWNVSDAVESLLSDIGIAA